VSNVFLTDRVLRLRLQTQAQKPRRRDNGEYPTLGVFICINVGKVIQSRGRCVTDWIGSGAGRVEQVEVGSRLKGEGE